MTSKDEIILNQSNFQDLLDCPRRFQLSNIDRLTWPAPPGEPQSKYEHLLEIGNQFHSLCHRYFTGLDADLLTGTISDPELTVLWKAFLPFGEKLSANRLYPEIVLTTSIDDFTVTAKYDLLLQEKSGRIIIYDWKTSPNLPRRELLAARAQTILYPYLLIEAGQRLFEIPDLSPADLSMCYFYPLSSSPEVIFPYSDDQHKENSEQIRTWIEQLESMIETDNFPLTGDTARCKLCVFRSICDRGVKAGDVSSIEEIDEEDLSSNHFDFGQIIEIDY
jgi:RecB family exonuclease